MFWFDRVGGKGRAAPKFFIGGSAMSGGARRCGTSGPVAAQAEIAKAAERARRARTQNLWYLMKGVTTPIRS
jgi:hypothetical protein